MRLLSWVGVMVGHVVAAAGVLGTIQVVDGGFSWWALATGLVAVVGVSFTAHLLNAISERLQLLWIGTALAIGFGAWTVYLVQDGFTCWAVPTGLAALLGLLHLSRGFSPRPFVEGVPTFLPDLEPQSPFDGTTPFDGLIGPDARRTADRSFYSFVSYRSLDAEVVRIVAEQLIAAGYVVWFAEYAISWDERPQFQRAINNGLAKSQSGLAFTNDTYADSPHTTNELRQLLGPTGCGLKNLVEVRMPPQPRIRILFPVLNQPHCQHNASGEVDDVLTFLASVPRFSHLEPTHPTLPLAQQRYVEPSMGYELDVGGWEVVKLGGDWEPTGGRVGPKIKTILGGRLAQATLIVGRLPLQRNLDNTTDDQRRYYDAIGEFAENYVELVGHRPVGVHLVQHGGFSHYAATYWADKAWVRKYDLDLPQPGTDRVFEFVFTFAFFGTFIEFCRYACVFDAVVASLRWRRDS